MNSNNFFYENSNKFISGSPPPNPPPPPLPPPPPSIEIIYEHINDDDIISQSRVTFDTKRNKKFQNANNLSIK